MFNRCVDSSYMVQIRNHVHLWFGHKFRTFISDINIVFSISFLHHLRSLLYLPFPFFFFFVFSFLLFFIPAVLEEGVGRIVYTRFNSWLTVVHQKVK